MSSTFSGISGALSALQAQRRALDVTGQNIANVNTEGYTRQRVDMQAVGGSTVPAVWATTTGVGNGVAVSDVQRVRDDFQDNQARAAHTTNAYLTGQTATYSSIESVFAEPSDTALQAQMADLWAGFDDVANNPSDTGARTALLETASTITDGLNSAYTALGNQWTNTRDQLTADTTDVNSTASTIATLNDSIRKATAAGLPVNEMADQRDKYVMHLSEMVGATASTRDDGTVDVYLAGSSLVTGSTARQIQLSGATRLQDQAATPIKMTFTDTGHPAVLGGTIASGVDTLSSVIPTYANGLDDVAAKLASTVNSVHTAGYGLDGVGGRPMFTGTTASTISVAITDGSQIAASGTPGGNLDGSNADALARLGSSATGPDASYRQMIANLGVASQATSRRADIQTAITQDADAAVASTSGVNLDEEMTNMLSYQRAYEAASRVVTTVDSVLDTIINHMAA